MWQMFLLFLVTTIAGELLRPKPKFGSPTPSALGDFQLPTAEYGRAVPVVYGECHLKGPNVTWYGDLKTVAIREKVKTSPFSSKKITTGYKYYMGAQLVFCKGFSAWELENGSGLVELRFDDRKPTAVAATRPARAPMGQLVPPDMQAYNTTYTHTNIHASTLDSMFTRVNIQNENLFGGEGKEGGISGVIDFHFGQAGAVPNDYLQRVFGSASVPAYRGYCHAVLRQCYIGTTSYPKPVSAIVRRYPWFWDTASGWQVGFDANPIAVVVDLMTNADYGLGIPLTQLGSSFKKAAMTCFSEGSGVSMLFDSQGTARDMISEVLRHVDGVTYTDPATGKYEVVLARDDYDLADVLELDPDNVLSLEMSRPSWAETKNVVRVKYVDAANNYVVSIVEQQNLANIHARGGVRADETYTYLGLSNSTAANNVAARVLRTVSYPLARFSMTINRQGYALRPGSVVTLSWPELGIDRLACRVTRISYGSLTEPAVMVEAVEDIFGTLDTDFAVPPPSEWRDPITELTINAAERLLEVPYHLMGGAYRNVMTLASRSSYLAKSYKIISSPYGVPVETGSVSDFTPSGRLTEVLTAAASELSIDGVIDVDALPPITAAQQQTGVYLLLIGDELLTFNAATANLDGSYTFTGLKRGVLDTLPGKHAAGARAWVISEGAGLVQSAAFSSDTTVTARLVPFDNTRQVPTDSAALLSLTTKSRALKPYPPGRVRVNDSVAPDSVTAPAVLSWAHRPRAELLAAGVLPDQDATGYNAEPGTSYTVEVYLAGALVRTVADILGTSFTYTAEMRAEDHADTDLPVQFKLYALNNGHSSAKQTTSAFVMT